MAEESREPDEQRIIIAGGGTGGHVNPGLAIARELLRRRPKREVLFVGTAAGLEARLVPAAGLPLQTIRASGVVGKGIVGCVRGLGQLALGWIDSNRILRRFRPHVVVGVGGYASAPMVLAAAIRRVPTMIHEQNRFPGVTNRILSPLVDRTAVSFEGTVGGVGRRGVITGNPVRRSFIGLEPWSPAGGRPRLLVFGGSRGARSINDAMVEALPELPAELRIRHQTGPDDRERIAEAYLAAGRGEQEVEAYIDDMAEAFRDAGLVVCRAGASTLAELAVAGRASILIPFPAATHDHQRHNARGFVEAGASRMVDPEVLDGRSLTREILAMIREPKTLASMAAAARKLGRPHATEKIVDMTEELMEKAA